MLSHRGEVTAVVLLLHRVVERQIAWVVWRKEAVVMSSVHRDHLVAGHRHRVRANGGGHRTPMMDPQAAVVVYVVTPTTNADARPQGANNPTS